jgi:asparagine synthase (glutamine-hydrolysing)
MFAFAIWDSQEESLFLARDRLGEKPLSFAHLPNGGIVFASEIKALLSHPDVSREPDLQSIQLMLNYGYVPSPRSAYKDVKKLPPAHYLLWKDKKFSLTKYWTPPIDIQRDKSESNLITELDILLQESVALRMNSDRGVGAWLSGGVDSSLVTYYMSQIQDEPIETFSAGFKNNKFDESQYSLEVSKHLKTSHNLLTLDKGISETMPEIIEQLDEPFADSSFVATFLLSKFTSGKRVVVLGGDGGDEAFGGYERYRFMKLAHGDSFIANNGAVLSKLLNLIPYSRFLPKRLVKVKQILGGSSSPSSQYQNLMSWISQSEINALMGNLVELELHNWFEVNLFNSLVPSRSYDFSANLWDISSYLPGDLLPKVDIASMAFGLEVRSPFLDSEIMSFGLSIPDNLRVKANSPKHLLKQLARQKLPATIVDRPKKGFGIPRDEWLRGQLNDHLNQTLSESNVNLSNLLNMDVVKSRVAAFNNGEKSETEIWSLYMLGNWAAKWL